MKSQINRFIDFIDEGTSINDYKDFYSRHPEILTAGGRCGWTSLGMAASHGNVDLLNHIISKDPSLINLTNNFGWTPLMCACNSEVKDAYRSVLVLVDAKANINTKTTLSCGDSKFGDTPTYSSPIWEAFRRVNDRSFRILFIKGAIPLPPKTTSVMSKCLEDGCIECKCLEGECHRMVLWKNKATSIILKIYNKRRDCVFGNLPSVILDIIIKFLDPID